MVGMTRLLESFPPDRKMHTSALYSAGADWAAAELMKRRSPMAEVSAPVPSAAHAAWRRKLRRVRTENSLCFILLPLNDEFRGADDEMNDRANTVPHLGFGRGGGVGEPRRVRHVIDDDRFGRGRKL